VRLENPLTSELKSALQKVIRRHDATLAIECAAGIWRDWPTSLLRRLPVIAVEDCGWETMASVHPILQKYAKRKADDLRGDIESMREVLGIVKFLAETKKNVTVGFTHTLGGLQKVMVDDWQDEFRQAIESKDLKRLASIAIGLEDQKEKISPAKQCSYLRTLIPKNLPEPIQIAQLGIQKRISAGGMYPWDFQLFTLATAAGAMGIWDDKPVESIAPIEDLPPLQNVIDLEWNLFDMHVWWGKIAYQTAAKKLGFDYSRFIWLGWWFESRPYDSSVKGADILEQAITESLKAETGLTVEEAKTFWIKEGRPVVKELIEWACRTLRSKPHPSRPRWLK